MTESPEGYGQTRRSCGQEGRSGVLVQTLPRPPPAGAARVQGPHCWVCPHGHAVRARGVRDGEPPVVNSPTPKS